LYDGFEKKKSSLLKRNFYHCRIGQSAEILSLYCDAQRCGRARRALECRGRLGEKVTPAESARMEWSKTAGNAR
jgi:hypothetical protein